MQREPGSVLLLAILEGADDKLRRCRSECLVMRDVFQQSSLKNGALAVSQPHQHLDATRDVPPESETQPIVQSSNLPLDSIAPMNAQRTPE